MPTLTERLVDLGLLGTPSDAERSEWADVDHDNDEFWDSEVAEILFRRWGNTGGLRHGFLAHDWRFGSETQDVIAELAQALADERLAMRQLSMKDGVIEVEVALDGETFERHSINVTSLADVGYKVDAWLAASGAARRVFQLETGGDWHAFLLCSPEVMDRLRGAGMRLEDELEPDE